LNGRLATHHGNTSSLGPVVPLSLGSEERPSGLQEGLVNTSTSGNDTDGSTGERRDGLLGTGRKPDPGLLVVNGVTDDSGVVTRSSGERTTVTSLLLDVANDGSLGALTDGEDVSDVQGSLLSAVDERSGRETLGSDESLLSDLVSVRVSEDDSSQGGTSDEKQDVARSVKGRQEETQEGEATGIVVEVRVNRIFRKSAASSYVYFGALPDSLDPDLHSQHPRLDSDPPLPYSHLHRFRLDTHRPVSWMMSLTIPRMYPFFSAKSRGLSLAGFFLLWVWALKIPPDLRWFLMTRCELRVQV